MQQFSSLRASALVVATVLAHSGAGCASSSEQSTGVGSVVKGPGPVGGSTTQRVRADGEASIRPLQPGTAASTAQLREQAVALLVDLAKTGTPEERANAMEGLGRSPGRLARVAPDGLRDPNAGVRGVTALALARAKVCSVKNEVQTTLDDPSPLVRASAMLSLWRCGVKVDPTPLSDMLKSGQPNERAHAAYVLGEMGESSARVLLAEAARDSVKRASAGSMRIMDLQIAEARVKLGDDDALTDIRTALYPARNEDLEAAAVAAQMAGELQDRGATNALIYLTSVKDDHGRVMPAEVRLAAAGSLAKLNLPQGVSIAREYLGSSDPAQRAQAAMVLGSIGNPENLPTLERLLKDASGRVRIAAAASILRTADRAGVGER